MLFTFHDGTRRRKVDPLRALFLLNQTPGYHPNLIDEAASGDYNAVRLVAEIVRNIFRVELVEDGGTMTVLDCVQLLDRFDRQSRQVLEEFAV